MTKSAAIILSSPRKGSNSSILGLAVGEGFRRAGGRAEAIDLSGLDIKPCLSCLSCQHNGGRCSQLDGMHTVYPKLVEASVLVLATPVYMFNVSAQLKIFLDRCYALMYALKPSEFNVLAGKTMAAAISYGADDFASSGAANIVHSLEDFCRYLQITWKGYVHGCGLERDILAKNETILEEARAFGEKLIT